MFYEENKIIEECVTLNDSEIRRILVDYYYTKYNSSYVVGILKIFSSSLPYIFLNEYIIMTPTMYYNDKDQVIVYLNEDEKNDIETVKSKLPFYVSVLSKEEIYEIFKINGYFLHSLGVENFGGFFETEATMQIIDVPYKVLK